MHIRVKSPFRFRFPEFLLALLVIISGVFLAFTTGSFVVNFSRIGFSIFSSAEKGIFFVTNSVGKQFAAVRELSELKRNYDELVIKLQNYEQMQRTNAEIRKENEQLKEQLDFVKSLEQKNYPAQIISRDTDKLYASLTIDKGSVNGIGKNMPVIAYQNGNIALVGKVIEVGRFTSSIMPIYSIDCTVSARIQNTRDLGLLSGFGDDTKLSLKYIKKRVMDTLNYGDVIVTSGENGNYMRNVPIGSISEIRVVEYDSSLEIDVAPLIDFERLETVIVVDVKSEREETR
ncbi:rod shape-determining protein MreC [Treponema sp. Marseille-Q4132]|uniref:rod shape-determining protein MreC n=1 Tax=Treponema sp. Marseille-Q4132 TaxID=2766701 RepID=UPI00165327D4|nr:rod shape-determining protein MreC [Treponema sp. Marseille-Q4132]QNL97463.1 rod shape-determining protein MreC [Treponema sp. Marseille-Q4132]